MKTALERLKLINSCNHPDGVIRFSHDKLESIIEQLEEERGAIPADVHWPLFEDGWTVLVGDEFEHDRCGTCKVESITFRDGYCVLNYGTKTAFVVGSAIGCDAERVKRPSPKSLGSDELRANEGETEGMSGHDGDVLAWVEEHGGLSQMEDIYNDFRAVVERLGIEWSESELHGLMDALDRRLMPKGVEWPRTDMGEPVKIGDRLIDDDALEEWSEVDTIIFQRTEGGYTVEIENDRGVSQLYEPGERVKLPDFQKSKEIDAPLSSYSDVNPATKVLDADGAETTVGDKCYVASNGDGPYVVYGIRETDGAIDMHLIENDNVHLHIRPDMITHRAPVLSGDDKPLHEGEAVWDENGHEWRVDCFSTAFASGRVRVRDSNGWMRYVEPGKLTHERPNPWGRLDDDCTLPPRTYYAKLIGHDAGIKSDEEISAAVLRHVAGRAKALALMGRDD